MRSKHGITGPLRSFQLVSVNPAGLSLLTFYTNFMSSNYHTPKSRFISHSPARDRSTLKADTFALMALARYSCLLEKTGKMTDVVGFVSSLVHCGQLVMKPLPHTQRATKTASECFTPLKPEHALKVGLDIVFHPLLNLLLATAVCLITRTSG